MIRKVKPEELPEAPSAGELYYCCCDFMLGTRPDDFGSPGADVLDFLDTLAESGAEHLTYTVRAEMIWVWAGDLAHARDRILGKVKSPLGPRPEDDLTPEERAQAELEEEAWERIEEQARIARDGEDDEG